MKRAWSRTTEEIYAYRCRKPHAVWGLPFIGRHWGYVGRTTNGVRRDAQHRYGYVWDGERKEAQPWADLIVKRYVVCGRKRRYRWSTHFLEWFWIWLLMPVYNVSMNRANPRRVKPWDAQRQRAARDEYGTVARVVPAVGQWVLVGVVGGAVVWGSLRVAG